MRALEATLFLVPFLLWQNCGWAEPPGTETPSADEKLTLQRAVETALSSNPLIRATRSERAGTAARLSEAQAGWLPTLQAGETVTRSNNPVFVFGSLLEQGQFGPQNFTIDSLNNPGPVTNFRSSINLNLPLFSQFRTTAQVAESKAALKQSDAQQDAVEQRVRFETVQAYYGVLLAQSSKEAADESVRLAESELKRMKDLLETGRVVASDVLAMQVQLAEFQQHQIAADGEVEISRVALGAAMGMPLARETEIAPAMPERPLHLPEPEELTGTALAQRPDYQQAGLDVERLGHSLLAAKGQYLPEVNLFASAGNSAENIRGNNSSDYAFGGSLTLNLFDAGRSPRIRQAAAARDAAMARQQHQADQIRWEVMRAYRQCTAAAARLKVASEAAKQAEEMLRTVCDRYDVGLVAITELLRAQTAAFQAKMNRHAAQYDYSVGYAATLLAAGMLRDVDAFAK